MNITVLGAGNFGTAIGENWAYAGHKVTFWCIEKDVVRQIETKKRNRRYLPGVELSKNTSATNYLDQALANAHVVVFAMSSARIPEVAEQARLYLPKDAYLVVAAKGLNAKSGQTLVETVLDELPKRWANRIAQMSGPSFASEIVREHPTVVTLASKTKKLSEKLAKELSTKMFKVRPTTDLIGVSLGGALKNVYVIGLGITQQLYPGINASTILLDQAVKEMTLLATSLGAQAGTMSGPAGQGDLIATGLGAESRNLRFGKLVGRIGAKRAKRRSKTTTEGLTALKQAFQLARKKKLDTPLLKTIHTVVYQEKDPLKEMQKLFKKLG